MPDAGHMPRSRIVLVVAFVAAVVLAAAGFVVLHSDEPPPPAASPAAELPQGTVLLIPGYGGGTSELMQLQAELEQQDITTEIVGVGGGDQDLRSYASLAAERARGLRRAGAPAPDVIGYSAGGLTARIAVTDNPDLFRKVVMIATPNAGTQAAELGAQFGQCPTACEQMRPGSDLLDSLPEPDDPGRWLSVWSDTDSVVRPPDSSVLPGTTDYRLQAACDRPVDHGQVPTDSQTLAAVTAFLASASLPESCVA